jgi:hypothetical protein
MSTFFASVPGMTFLKYDKEYSFKYFNFVPNPSHYFILVCVSSGQI